MEALTAVATACLTVYDMVKAVEKSMVIEGYSPCSEGRRQIRAVRGRDVISVDEALGHIFDLARPTLEPKHVPLRHALGRVLAEPIVATRDQPPFRASVMDGYAVAGERRTPTASSAKPPQATATRELWQTARLRAHLHRCAPAKRCEPRGHSGRCGARRRPDHLEQ